MQQVLCLNPLKCYDITTIGKVEIRYRDGRKVIEKDVDFISNNPSSVKNYDKW